MALGICQGYIFAISTANTDNHSMGYVTLLMDIFNILHNGPLSAIFDPSDLFSTHQAIVIFQKVQNGSCKSIQNQPIT